MTWSWWSFMWFVVGWVLASIGATLIVSLFGSRSIMWWRGRSEHLEKLICKLAKEYPSKLWNGLPNNVKDECQRIIEKSYERDWRIE